MTGSSISKSFQLKVLMSKWAGCTECAIGVRAAYKVHHRGSLNAEVLFIGEAPGKTEDVTGKPFDGASGNLLDKCIGVVNKKLSKPFTWAITNLVACRPCDYCGGPNRAPHDFEISSCSGRLTSYLNIIQPTTVVLLGKVAQEKFPAFVALPGNRTLNLPHPAWVLRQGGESSAAFKAMCKDLCTWINNSRE